MAPKILFITRAYGTQAGGMERLSYELIEAIGKLPDFETTILANTTPPGASLLTARIRSVLFLFTILPRTLVLARNYDLVYISDPVLSLVGRTVQLICGKPVAVTVHGLDIHFKNIFYQFYLKLFFRNLTLYFPISTYVESLLASFRVRGTVVKINPGLSDRYFDPTITRDRLAEILGRNISEKKILLTTGRLVRRKGHAWFIREVLPNLPPNAIYLIVGDGPEREHIADLIAKLELQDQVFMLGRVEEAILKILYNTVDMFIQPNINDTDDIEGFGLVLTEAALCRCPVFVSRFQGMTDAVHDGKNGFQVDLENKEEWIEKITNFLEHPDALPKVREYTLEHFSWDVIAQQYRNVFLSILQP